MKKQLLLIAALLSAGLIQAERGSAAATEARDSYGRFTKVDGRRAGYKRGAAYRRPIMTIDEKLARNAQKAADLEVVVAALHKTGANADIIARHEEKLKRTNAYRAKLEAKKAAGKTHVRGGKRGGGWFDKLGLAGLGYGAAKTKKDEAKAATKNAKGDFKRTRKALTEDEKKARKEAREARKAERVKKQAVRRAAVDKTVARA